MPEKRNFIGLTPEGAKVSPDPRFTYMTREEAMELGARIAPHELHTEHIKRQKRDIAYGPMEGQVLDIYWPEEGEGPFPAILYVHGGGWVLGTRASSAIDLAIDGVNRGYAVIGIDYRLVPTIHFPEMIWDVKAAIRFLRANAKEFMLDPERFGMMGDSAGGHITLMCAVTGTHPEYEGPFGNEDESTMLQACVSLYGPANMDTKQEDEWYLESGAKRMSAPTKPSLYDIMFGADVDNLLYLVSPINMVSKDMPPVLFQHGSNDPVVPYQHSVTMCEKIRRICGPDHAEIDVYDGWTHSDPQFLSKECADRFYGFFDKYLK